MEDKKSNLSEQGELSSELTTYQNFIDQGIHELNPRKLYSGLFADDGKPRDGVEVSIHELLEHRAKLQKDINLDNYHPCLRHVIRYMKATGTEELKSPPSTIHPLKRLRSSPTFIEDFKVLLQEFGPEHIDFDEKNKGFDYLSASKHALGDKIDITSPEYIAVKSYISEYIKLRANESDNESLKHAIMYYFQQATYYPEPFKYVVANLPVLIKSALEAAKEDMDDGKESELNQASNALDADILGCLYNIQQRALKDEAIQYIPFSLQIAPLILIIPMIITTYIRRPIGKLDLTPKQVLALVKYKTEKLDEEDRIDEAPYSKMSFLSPVTKNSKLRPIMLNGQDPKSDEKKQLFYTKVNSNGKSDCRRGLRLLSKIRSAMHKQTESETQQDEMNLLLPQ